MRKHNTAISYLVFLLSRREYSLKELKDKLRYKNEFTNQEKEEALCIITNNNWQSDIRYAEVFIYSKFHQGYGKSYIIRCLKLKGINDNIIESLISNEDYDWLESAKDVFNRKSFGLDLNKIKDKQRLYRYMINRGFYNDEFYYLFNE